MPDRETNATGARLPAHENAPAGPVDPPRWVAKALTDGAPMHHRSKTALLAEIGFTLSLPGMPPSVRAPSLPNLLWQRERHGLSRSLAQQVPEVEWSAKIDALCRMALGSHRKGEPAMLLRDPLRTGGVAYALRPLVLANAPTVWFADGGTGKSLLALAAACAMSGHDVFGGLKPGTHRRVRYLGWEWDDSQHANRLQLLLGADLDAADLLYRRCNRTPADEIEAIRQVVADEEVRFVVVDSLGAACGGDLIDASTASEFARLMRALGIGSLWITHTTKSGRGEDDKPFGTVFFHDTARLTWRIQRQADAGKHEFEVGFHNHKSNATLLHRPLRFRVRMEGERKRAAAPTSLPTPSCARACRSRTESRHASHTVPRTRQRSPTRSARRRTACRRSCRR